MSYSFLSFPLNCLSASILSTIFQKEKRKLSGTFYSSQINLANLLMTSEMRIVRFDLRIVMCLSHSLYVVYPHNHSACVEARIQHHSSQQITSLSKVSQWNPPLGPILSTETHCLITL